MEHVDVVIVGAGLSGIGAARHLQKNLPHKSYAILESREAIGGTWDLFRYPGIRSDSDMYTLGYSFKPWTEAKAIADGSSIRSYVRETAAENGIDRHIRFGQRLVGAEFSTETGRWTLRIERREDGETIAVSCGFVFMCTGYYRYDRGYTPQFEGREDFRGPLIHPQTWDESLDYEGKRVVVIGSGATAVTLVPAMAEQATHVTMLQRSPSYVLSIPGQDGLAHWLRRRLPPTVAYALVRGKNVMMAAAFFGLSRKRPRLVRRMIRGMVSRQLPGGYDVDTHFNPSYNPWDQRLCLVPDGDLFEAISAGRASVVTDRVDRFTPGGIRLESGRELEADVIITATGLELLPLGGTKLAVDGRAIDISQTVGYRGMMLSGVPNLAVAIGYANASWTLKCDLTCEFVCRLLRHMEQGAYDTCVAPEPGPEVERQPFIDFNSGYVLRAIDSFPKQGAKPPWRLYQNYPKDLVSLRLARVSDGTLKFARAA